MKKPIPKANPQLGKVRRFGPQSVLLSAFKLVNANSYTTYVSFREPKHHVHMLWCDTKYAIVYHRTDDYSVGKFKNLIVIEWDTTITNKQYLRSLFRETRTAVSTLIRNTTDITKEKLVRTYQQAFPISDLVACTYQESVVIPNNYAYAYDL